MNKKQRKLIAESGLDASEIYTTSDGWSHNGFVAWQLELSDESKRVSTADSEISTLLRTLDDLE